MTLNRKKHKSINLLEISNNEKLKILKEVKENLQQKIFEEKLLKSLLEAEILVINGETIYNEEERAQIFISGQNYKIS